MKTFLLMVLMGVMGFTSLASATDRPIGSLGGMVVNIYDGGNITLNSDGTQLYVQLYGVEAPQMPRISRTSGWLRKPGQPFAREAFIALANKVLHKQVRLEILQILPYRQAPYQQAVAIVWLDDRNINLEMVGDGWAWAAPLLDRAYLAEYRHAQNYARIHRRGLWMQDHPLPPWAFRQQNNFK